ncbi:RHS repeat domain-containing protein [Chryseobacterium rhizosphaerae]|uniref:RHS repeat domain-containing protein n=1 Tax=Chryseobacterium rhizosphaerae TaxID=395937 RepID=UPI00235991A5|nr:RHS repeat domain-containing protein [Chryseobacterium rhizosphaerae]MDC8099539.1 RHS repeat protein [Chryseobacterium rhizosphaerae]
MKKIIVLLSMIAGVVPLSILAQQSGSDINFGDLPRPVPSVSSLIKYTDAPVSLATGVPEITIPLLGLPSNDKSIGANLFLQYHPLNSNATEAGSEVGIGWSMFKGGVISREVVDELDERYDDASFSGYKKNKFNDIYYYNLPGISGKFKIERNTDNNTFQIVNLTPNNIKIEYTRDSNTATLIVNTFIITDDNGYKYIFNDYSQSRSYTHPLTSGSLYKSAFYLTEIKNADNVQLLNFTYQKENKNKPGTSVVLYQSSKLKTIVSPGLGSIMIDYNYDASLEGTMNDPYSITQVSLKNNRDEIISQYGFEYVNQVEYKRTLIKINKINVSNPTGIPLEITKLLYNTFYFNTSGEKACTATPANPDPGIGTLNRVIFPTGGVVEYNFEANQYYKNKNYPEYVTADSFSDPEVQFMDGIQGLDFDTHIKSSYTFQVPGEPGKLRKIYVDFEADKYIPTFGDIIPQSFVDYTIDNDPSLTTTCYSFNEDILEGRTWSSKTLYLMPGTHTMKITGTGGHGLVGISGIGSLPAPYQNAVSIDKKLGIRIRDIKYYNSQLDYQPQKTVSYKYFTFNDPNSSSGYFFYPEMESTSTEYTPVVLYKNVKVTNDIDNGYVNYYFKNPNDYPKFPYTYKGSSTNFWPYYNLTKSGVMEKKEVFNNQNQLVSAVNYDFTFETLDQLPEIPVDGGVTKKAYIKNTKVITKDYTGSNRFVENSVETAFNPTNFKVTTVKEALSDGNVAEKVISYSTGTAEYQRLENAFMTGIPVKTEIKNNGKLVSNTMVKYENSGNLYPSSVVTVNPNDNSNKVAVKYDEYDSKGNLKQLTSNYDATAGTGTSSVIIWGYYQNFPIAKIEGAKLSDIGTLADDIVLKSNADVDASSENILLNALDNFRATPALKNFMITTYTYDPLIGATTVTPANGLREIYKYDKNGRLTSVVDVNGNIIKDYKYNTKPQL